MKKSTKGAVAASAAALLLMGGLGTQAKWGAGEQIAGTPIESGSLDLFDLGCDGWKIGADLVDPASIKIIPGTVLTQVCTFRVDAVGYGLQAKVGAAADPTVNPKDPLADAGLVAALDATATLTQPNGAALPASLANEAQIKATITVTLPDTAAGSIQNMEAVLAAYTVTIDQV